MFDFIDVIIPPSFRLLIELEESVLLAIYKRALFSLYEWVAVKFLTDTGNEESVCLKKSLFELRISTMFVICFFISNPKIEWIKDDFISRSRE